MDRLQTMRTFLCVADLGSFAAAARALDTSPAGVTRMVGDLEEHLGIRLMQRTTRKLALTQSGEAYLSKVRDILSAVDAANEQVNESSQELSGVIKISSPPMVSAHVLAPLLAEFRSLHPRVVIDLHVDSSSNHQNIENFDITLFGASEKFDANVIARPLFVLSTIICAAPSYLHKFGEPKEPSDLKNYACLTSKREGSHIDHWDLINASQTKGLSSSTFVLVTTVLSVNNGETLLQATLSGAGISTLPQVLVMNFLKNGQLQQILPSWIAGRFTVYAAIPSRKFIPNRTRVFLDFITEKLRASLPNL